jgi:hypothetical protein
VSSSLLKIGHGDDLLLVINILRVRFLPALWYLDIRVCVDEQVEGASILQKGEKRHRRCDLPDNGLDFAHDLFFRFVEFFAGVRHSIPFSLNVKVPSFKNLRIDRLSRRVSTSALALSAVEGIMNRHGQSARRCEMRLAQRIVKET